MSVPYNSNYGPPFGSDFIPNLQYITNITQSAPAIVTFAGNHNFTVAEWISFRVPPPNGMIQLNNQKAQILSITPTTVTIAVDTFKFLSVYICARPSSSLRSSSGRFWNYPGNYDGYFRRCI